MMAVTSKAALLTVASQLPPSPWPLPFLNGVTTDQRAVLMRSIGGNMAHHLKRQHTTDGYVGLTRTPLLFTPSG